MTEPSQPISETSIMVALTKIEGKLDTSLTVQALHSTEIAEHRKDISVIKDKVTVLETARSSENQHQTNQLSRRAVLWTAVGAIAAVAAIVFTIWATRP